MTFLGHTECLCSLCAHIFEAHQEWGQCHCQKCEKFRYLAGRAKERREVATISMCERVGCGSMSNSTNMGKLNFQTAQDREVQRLELCPGCVGELVEFLATEPTEERPKAYREAWKPKAEEADPTEMTTEELGALWLKRMREETENAGRKSIGG